MVKDRLTAFSDGVFTVIIIVERYGLSALKPRVELIA